MKKHIFFIVRYSMLSSNGVGWKIGSEDTEAYKQKLFDPERLWQREHLFEKITLPSLVSLEECSEEFSLLILTSSELPAVNLERLENMVKPYLWAKIIKLPNNNTMGKLIEGAIKEELEKFSEEVCYSTTRIDDDDALAINFCKSLSKYVDPKYEGFCISFPNGYSGIYNDKKDKFEAFYEMYEPKIALGLSYINTYDPGTNKYGNNRITIFNNGSHTKIDQISPTILDSREPVYIRTVHSASDTNTTNQLKKAKENKIVNPEIIREAFTIKMEAMTLIELKQEQRNEVEMKKKIMIEEKHSETLSAELETLRKELYNVKKEMKTYRIERKRIEEKLKSVQQSRSWRFTKPLRMFISLLKRLVGKKRE